jgi:hypothetical protein
MSLVVSATRLIADVAALTPATIALISAIIGYFFFFLVIRFLALAAAALPLGV